MTQLTTDKDASPPGHREMEGDEGGIVQLVTLGVAQAQRLRVSETEGGLCHGGSESSDIIMFILQHDTSARIMRKDTGEKKPQCEEKLHR